jgi:hypothetical protein
MRPQNTDQNLRLYTLKLTGTLEDEFTNSYCPAGTVLLRENGTVTLSNMRTDQSGIIGLIRHLHNLGYTILSLDS